MTAEDPTQLPRPPVLHDRGEADAGRRLRHELLQLSALIIMSIGAFILTRALAAGSRQRNLNDAAEWHRRGERAVAADHTEAAVDAFRRAAAKNRTERTYVLALARALERGGDAAAAERTLLALRDSTPEDAEVNLGLARLAAARHDVEQALRGYRNALYTPSSAADAETRRATRLELIRFLIDHRDLSHALAELLVASSDSPGDVSAELQLGELFARVGDHHRAQDQFERVLRSERRNVEALVGAGAAAFEQGRYVEALRYLRAAPPNRRDVQDRIDVAELVTAHDPLGNRLTTAERRRRLTWDLTRVQERLESCVARGQSPPGAKVVSQQIDQFRVRLSLRAASDEDVVDPGVDLIRLGTQAAASCDAPSALDHALLLIARLHAEEGR